MLPPLEAMAYHAIESCLKVMSAHRVRHESISRKSSERMTVLGNAFYRDQMVRFSLPHEAGTRTPVSHLLAPAMMPEAAPWSKP